MQGIGDQEGNNRQRVGGDSQPMRALTDFFPPSWVNLAMNLENSYFFPIELSFCISPHSYVNQLNKDEVVQTIVRGVKS